MLFTSGFILPSGQRDVEILLKVGSNFSEVQAYSGDMASLVQDHCNKANIANSSYMIFFGFPAHIEVTLYFSLLSVQ